MLHSLDLHAAAPIQVREQPTGRTPNMTFAVAFAMCAVGLALSLITLALPDWIFHPADVTSFPLP